MDIMQINENIFRLTIPYKDIYTTVLVVKTPAGALLFDTASYDSDITDYVVPMLEELGVTAQELKYVFISHNHTDHAGGLEKFHQQFPDTCIVAGGPTLQERYANAKFLAAEDGGVLLDVLKIVTIPGHTPNCCAILDTRTNTMISGDCLQLYGIFGSGKWACNIGLPTAHLEAIEKVRVMGVEELITAHDYHPYGYWHKGADAVQKVLDACVEPLMKIKELILANPEKTDEEICAFYNGAEKLPTLGVRVPGAIRREWLTQ